MDDVVRSLNVLSTVSPDVTWAPPRTELVAPPQTAGGEATLYAVSPTPPVPPDVWHVLAPAMPPGPLPVPPSPKPPPQPVEHSPVAIATDRPPAEPPPFWRE